MPSKARGAVKKKAGTQAKNPALLSVISELRAMVKKSVPGVRETTNPWGLPTFELQGPFLYFMVGKNHVTFGFLQGTSLADPHKLLEGTGKNLRHVKLRGLEDLNREGMRELIQSAARRNVENPTPAMGGAGKLSRGRK
jgi:hypothetical protein